MYARLSRARFLPDRSEEVIQMRPRSCSVLGHKSRLNAQGFWRYDWIAFCTNTAKSVQHTTTSWSPAEGPLAGGIPAGGRCAVRSAVLAPAERRGLAQSPDRPDIGRVARHLDMHYAARTACDDEAGRERAA